MSSGSATEPITVTTLADSQAWARKFLIVLFTLSGFSGLIYENIWSYYLKLFLGHAAYAQTLVIAIFMGGMAIGAWLSAKYSSRWPNTLQAYAIAEGVIGIFGLFFHGTFERATDLAYSTILPALVNPFAITIFKWGLSTLLILPQSVLLGMTFPLMSASLVRHSEATSGSTIALLYFANSMGAAVGVLLSGFWLIGLVGLPGTILTAALLNILIALFAWLLSRPQEDGLDLPVYPESRIVASIDPFYWLMLSVALLTGVASFIYEVGWIRMLSLVMGSSTHSFELMLSAFILGLAFGGLWIKHRIDRVRNTVQALAIVQIVMGLLAMVTIALYPHTFELMQSLVLALGKTDGGYILFNILSYLMSLTLMVPATFCAGMTLPLLTHILLQHRYGERSVGHIYAANTVGAIVGVFCAVHLGMPLLGLKGMITFGATLDMAVGLMLLWHLRETSGYQAFSYGAVAVVFSVGITTMGVQWDVLKMASGVFRHGSLMKSHEASVLYHKDGKTASIDLVDHGKGVLSIRTNGKSDAGLQIHPQRPRARDESTMIFLAALPLALHPEAKTVANIGFGSGLTSHVLLGNNRLELVDTIEIEPAVVEASKGFRPRVEAVYVDPRSHIYFDDAKTYFSSHGSKYDIIVSEPSNPWVSGVSSLFTDEFYRTIKTHLNDKGLFVQWFHLYEVDPEIVFSVLKAIDSNFSDFTLYKSAINDLIIVASNGGNVSVPTGAPLQFDSIRNELASYGIRSGDDIAMWKVAEREMLLPLLLSFEVPVNSDYFPYLDLHAPRTFFLNMVATEIVELVNAPVPVLEMLGEKPLRYDTENRNDGGYFFRTQAALQASLARRYLFEERLLPGEKMSQDLQRDLALIKLNMMECARNRETDGWFNALLSLAATTNPHQEASDAEKMWAYLEAESCPETMTQSKTQWISLFKAVGKRDARESFSLSEELLAHSRDMSFNQISYLLMAGMTSALALHDKKGAMTLWEKYEPRIQQDSRTPRLAFRLLVAHGAISHPISLGLATR